MEDKNEELKTAISEFYKKLFDDIGLIKETSLFSSSNSLDLMDLYVPLRSDHFVNLKIEGKKIKESTINTTGDKTILKIGADGNTQDQVNIDKDFAKLLVSQLSKFIFGQDDQLHGINIAKRPLILSTPWSDGWKEKFANLDVITSIYLYNRVVLLGSPGSGKSTIAKVLASSKIYKFARPNESNPKLDYLNQKVGQDIVPIYTEIKELFSEENIPSYDKIPTASDFLSFFEKKIKGYTNSPKVWEYIKGKLANGKVIFVFDGLDEIMITERVPDALERRRDQVKSLIMSVEKNYPSCKIVVTSRPAGYSGWSLYGFSTLRMLPLNKLESEDVIESVLRLKGIPKEKNQNEVQLLSSHLTKIPQTLRQQPLFIVLLTLLYLKDVNSELPVRRAALLDHSIRLLMQNWSLKIENEKNIIDILGCSQSEILKILSSIAYKSLKIERSIDGQIVDDNYIERRIILDEFFEHQDLKMQETLSFISERSGILTSPAPRKYKFAHRLFAEYLAAKKLISQGDYFERLPSLLINSFQTWQEVTLLVCDILNEKGRSHDIWFLIEAICQSEINKQEKIWLCSKIILEEDLTPIESISIQAIIGVLRNHIYDTSVQGMPPEKIDDITRALSSIGDSRLGIGVKDNVPEVAWCQINCREATVGLTDELIRLIDLESSEDWKFSREIPSRMLHDISFKLSYYPVTIAQFNSFIQSADGYHNDENWDSNGLNWKNSHNQKRTPSDEPLNYPQTKVNWYEANAFCKWLSVKLNKTIRLPSEFEWEIAAKNCKESIFPWGNDFKVKNVNTYELGFHKVMAVGAFELTEKPETNRPFDLVGNIWEWCSSIVEKSGGLLYNYDSSFDTKREDQSLGINFMRATRGGYYKAALNRSRSSYRGRDIPTIQVERQGFRIATSF